MVPLVELSPRVFVLPGGVNIGVLLAGEGACILVDTGLNETSARKALKAVREELGAEVVAIVTTHAHADHFGGNATVVKRSGARVYAPAFDEAILRYPLLQPICLFAGADPPASMRGGFMLADPSPVDVVIDEDRIEIAGVDIGIINLAGHSPNQIGLLVDGVFFCADVVLPETVLSKYKIPYLFSVKHHRIALETANRVVCDHVVPGHGPTLGSISGLASLNAVLVEDVANRVVECAEQASSPEEILQRLLAHYDANPIDPPSYFLLHPTVFAFLSFLEETGRMSHHILGGRSLWRAL